MHCKTAVCAFVMSFVLHGYSMETPTNSMKTSTNNFSKEYNKLADKMSLLNPKIAESFREEGKPFDRDSFVFLNTGRYDVFVVLQFARDYCKMSSDDDLCNIFSEALKKQFGALDSFIENLKKQYGVNDECVKLIEDNVRCGIENCITDIQDDRKELFRSIIRNGGGAKYISNASKEYNNLVAEMSRLNPKIAKSFREEGTPFDGATFAFLNTGRYDVFAGLQFVRDYCKMNSDNNGFRNIFSDALKQQFTALDSFIEKLDVKAKNKDECVGLIEGGVKKYIENCITDIREFIENYITDIQDDEKRDIIDGREELFRSIIRNGGGAKYL